MTDELTPKQALTLRSIRSFTNFIGRPPTYRELSDMLDLNSTNSARQRVNALEKWGYLKITRNIYRGIVLEKKASQWFLENSWRKKGKKPQGPTAIGPSPGYFKPGKGSGEVPRWEMLVMHPL